MSEESNKVKTTKIEPRPRKKLIMRKRHQAYIMVDIEAIIAFTVGIIVGFILAVN